MPKALHNTKIKIRLNRRGCRMNMSMINGQMRNKNASNAHATITGARATLNINPHLQRSLRRWAKY
jgi:hypothetical protein